MHGRPSSLAMPLALLVLSTGSGGCLLLAAGAGAGGAVYVTGDTEEVLSATPDKVVDAAAAAFEALELTVISKNASKLEGEVIARTSDDKRITVTAKRNGDAASMVSVRVGTFGDESKQRRILDAIKGRL